MVKKLEFSDDEKDQFNTLQGLISNNVVDHLAFLQEETLSENELRELECALERLKKDTECCLIIVEAAKKFMGENNG